MRAIVLLPTATLPASPMTYGRVRVELPEERLGHDLQLTGRREPEVQQPRERQEDVFDLLERDGFVAAAQRREVVFVERQRRRRRAVDSTACA